MSKIFVCLSLVFLLILFFYFDLNRYVDLEFFIQKKQDLDLLYKRFPFLFPLGFLFFYVFCATLSLPGAVLLTLASGFLFGLFIGSFVVSVGSTLGATLSFFLSRFLFKDFIQKKFQSRLKTINEGLKKEGEFYVFSLRLVPIFPYFMINLLMGVTSIPTKKFVIASFLGMLPGSLVYVNAGTQLSKVPSVKELFSVPILLSFVFLAGLPWIMKLILRTLGQQKETLN